MTAKEMREKRAALAKQARVILDKADAEKRVTTAEEREKFDGLMGEMEDLRTKIERHG
ncbi:unnamed protein product, partial [marine sediment metagenome]